MDQLTRLASAVLDRAIEVLAFPLDPANRIYFVYLASSVLIAWLVYRAARRGARGTSPRCAELARGSFLGFLFPRSVWRHPSAWLDLRYMFFHKVVSHFLLLGNGAWALAVAFQFTSGGMSLGDAVTQSTLAGPADYAFAVGYMVFVLLVVDFLGWASHYMQHKLPLLWQFHKVHHSAEVMHPVSNFREHPIDNLLYGVLIGMGYGAAQGLAVRLFGYTPVIPTLLGLPVLMFLFNVAGYNLRHSHVWLRWPGRWSMVFPSPAHHHVHHSCHPDHIDKNFAFVFPVWDVIFRTYHMPEDDRDVRFGIDEDASELNSCLRLYWVPFRDAYRHLARRRTEVDETGRLPDEVTG